MAMQIGLKLSLLRGQLITKGFFQPICALEFVSNVRHLVSPWLWRSSARIGAKRRPSESEKDGKVWSLCGGGSYRIRIIMKSVRRKMPRSSRLDFFFFIFLNKLRTQRKSTEGGRQWLKTSKQWALNWKWHLKNACLLSLLVFWLSQTPFDKLNELAAKEACTKKLPNWSLIARERNVFICEKDISFFYAMVFPLSFESNLFTNGL